MGQSSEQNTEQIKDGGKAAGAASLYDNSEMQAASSITQSGVEDNNIKEQFGEVTIGGDVKAHENIHRLEPPVYIGGERAKPEDMHDMGIRGRFYANENGEVVKLDNGITVRAEDGKVTISNGPNSPKELSSTTNDKGIQTVKYADGTVITVDTANGQMVSIQQDGKMYVTPDGNVGYKSGGKVVFRDMDGDGVQEPQEAVPDRDKPWIKPGQPFNPKPRFNENVTPTEDTNGGGGGGRNSTRLQ